MYFDNIEVMNLKNSFTNLDKIYAHKKEVNDKTISKEKLIDHLNLTLEYFLDICKIKNLDNIFINLEKSLLKYSSKEAVQLWKRMIVNGIFLHDIGKINPNFQRKKMENKYYKYTNSLDSNHSMLSSCIYFDSYIDEVMKLNKEDKSIILMFLILNSFVLSKHHGFLGGFEEFKDNFSEAFKKHSEDKANNENSCICKDYDKEFSQILKENTLKKLDKMFKNCYKTMEKLDQEEKWKCINIYIYTRLYFGLLVSSDFYATYDYQNNKKVNDFGILDNVDEYYNYFRSTEVYKNICKYKEFLEIGGKNPFKEGDINKLRTEMFLETENNLIKNIDDNIFFLEAPTGSGKTNASINLALKLIENNNKLNKLFYIFPFNTLVEQTKDSLLKEFKGFPNIEKNISVINSITPIQTEDKEEDGKKVKGFVKNKEIDFEKSLLNRQFLHYPIVLTTHVNFFNYLFGMSRECSFPLAYLANSVVIIDEIQSYKNKIWKEIITFLNIYSKVLNIKIIIMSATLPDLSKLLDSKEKFTRLIKNRDKYFLNPLFKDRVKLDFSLLDLGIDEDIDNVLMDKVIKEMKNEQKNILIEFIKKNSAMEFFKKLVKENEELGLDRKVLLITGDDNKAERKRIINLVKNNKNIILVATQVIEAGVDIDMDIGFKDISILDADEQFLGRINRSCKKKNCKVIFFNKDEVGNIYREDFRKSREITLQQEKMQEILKNKMFYEFYERVMVKDEEYLNMENKENIDRFRQNAVCKLDFKTILDRMKLIDEDKFKYDIFLNKTEFDEKGNELDGEEVWGEFYNIIKDNNKPYAEKRVELSKVFEKMDYFIYEVKKRDFSYEDLIGDIYYIQNGEEYFTNGKFDREKFEDNKLPDIF